MTTRREVLDALEGGSGYVSGADLAGRLGISRAAVWKHIEALKSSGYDIEGARARGYRLVSRPEGLTEQSIRPRLRGTVIGSSIVALDVTRSTNSDAMALGREGGGEGTVVIAEEQTAGRGRLGRSWESRRGINLYMSILLRPEVAPHSAPQLSLVAGVAVAESVREEGIDARIKWPNDVVVRGGEGQLRKLCGILTEIEAEADRARFVVVGIGVNLNADASHFSPDLEGRATSLMLESGRTVDRPAFTARLLDRFGECYDVWRREGFAGIAPRWRALSILDGRRVAVDSPAGSFSGICAGIDNDGALLVDTGAAAPRRVLAGDVTLSGGYDSCQP